MKLYHKQSPLQKGAKVSYRTYISLSCMTAAASMILIGLASYFQGEDNRDAYFISSGCLLTVIFNIVRMRLENEKRLEQRDELAYFNQLKSIQILAVLAVVATFLLTAMTQAKIISPAPVRVFCFALAALCIVYTIVFQLFERTGE